MIQCQHCGQNNSGGSNFCRFCGNKFQAVPPKQNETNELFSQKQNQDYQQTPPRPYSWQTDEFQVKDTNARPTQQIDRANPSQNQPLVNPYKGNPNQQLQPQYQNTLSTGYHCPFCNSNIMPIVEKKVSPTGWAVFTVLLVTTFILFWIGLLIQEEVRICPSCKMRVG